jgi:LysM repeat protein
MPLRRSTICAAGALVMAGIAGAPYATPTLADSRALGVRGAAVEAAAVSTVPGAAGQEAEGCGRAPETWVVQPGDALGVLAQRFGISVAELKQWNRLQDDRIRVGQELRLGPGAGAVSGISAETYRVAEGDTLSGIASRRGVSVEQILDWNTDVDPDRIRVGRVLHLGEGRRRTSYTVQPGDSLSAIAARYRVSVSELRRWNARVERGWLHVGDVLTIYTELPESYSQSIGAPNHGSLQNASRLRRSPAYVIRDADRAWGTEETVNAITSALEAVRRAYRGTPRVMVHDLSLRKGGWIKGHFSHQSGRDADIAYYARDCGLGPCAFHNLTPQGLDAGRQWALLRHWLRRNMVEAIFVDYRLQKPLYEAARRQGATREQLERWFQYPRGLGHPGGIVRHFRKHADHLHVRFACHHTDQRCRSLRPLLAPAGGDQGEIPP